MNVTSKELCAELYELSGWDGDELDHRGYYGPNDNPMKDMPKTVPLYDLGYLLRKLPKEFDGYYFDLSTTTDGLWVAEYFTNDYTPGRPISKGKSDSDIPEDAACKLAIALFKQDVLKRENSNV